MSARVVLHLGAGVLPLAVVAVAVLLVFGRGALSAAGATEAGFIGLAAAAAAQIAALAGWPLLDDAARRTGWWRPLLTGVGMALLTHLLFGPIMQLVGRLHAAASYPSVAGLLLGALSLSLVSLLLVGWATAPLVAAFAVFVHRLRSKELARAAV